MVAPDKPDATPAAGKDTWWWVNAIAIMTAPTIVEINGGTNFICYTLSEQEQPTTETEKVTLPKLACQPRASQFLGESTQTFPDLVLAFDPQAAAVHLNKKAFELFRARKSGFLVRRQGFIAWSASPEAVTGQFFDVFRVETGEATPDKTSTGQDGIYVSKVPVGVLDAVYNVAAVAGA